MGRLMRVVGLAAVAAAAVSCGGAGLRESRSPVLLVMNSLQGASGGGAGANQFSSVLHSDVIVLLHAPAPCSDTNPCPTLYSDSGQAVFALTPKNLGVDPTAANQVTLTRYHVEFTRADGRNTPGVDVPFGFDGAVTATIQPATTVTVGFELVRHTSKMEAPLVQLVSNPNIIHALARVTFYGHDLAGNDISVTGSMSVDFGNFGDA
jgi:hypothetical protein